MDNKMKQEKFMINTDCVNNNHRFRNSVSLSPVSSLIEQFKVCPKQFYNVMKKNHDQNKK